MSKREIVKGKLLAAPLIERSGNELAQYAGFSAVNPIASYTHDVRQIIETSSMKRRCRREAKS